MRGAARAASRAVHSAARTVPGRLHRNPQAHRLESVRSGVHDHGGWSSTRGIGWRSLFRPATTRPRTEQDYLARVKMLDNRLEQVSRNFARSHGLLITRWAIARDCESLIGAWRWNIQFVHSPQSRYGGRPAWAALAMVVNNSRERRSKHLPNFNFHSSI